MDETAYRCVLFCFDYEGDLGICTANQGRQLKLEDLRPDTTLRGIVAGAAVTVVNAQRHGSDALTLIYRTASGQVAEEILYRHDEARLEVVEQGRPWSFDGDGAAREAESGLPTVRHPDVSHRTGAGARSSGGPTT